MNSKNSKPSEPHRLLFSLTEKIDLKRSDEYVALSLLVYTIDGKIWKNHIRTTNLKYQLPHGMKNLN